MLVISPNSLEKIVSVVSEPDTTGCYLCIRNQTKDAMPQMIFSPAVAVEIKALIDDLGLVFSGMNEDFEYDND